MDDDNKTNVIQIPTTANINHAFEKGKREGQAAGEAMLAAPPTPQQLLSLCRDAAKYDMNPKAREYLHGALELLSAHFNGDPNVYYADTKKVAGYAFVLGLHVQRNEPK